MDTESNEDQNRGGANRHDGERMYREKKHQPQIGKSSKTKKI